jgi:regulator of RNase E activity RraB
MRNEFRIFYGRAREPLTVVYNLEEDGIDEAYFESTETALSADEIELLEEQYLEEFKAIAEMESTHE